MFREGAGAVGVGGTRSVGTIIYLKGQSANNSCCTVFNRPGAGRAHTCAHTCSLLNKLALSAVKQPPRFIFDVCFQSARADDS